MARPSITIQYPRRRQFTIGDVITLNESIAHPYTIRTKVRRDIAAGAVQVVDSRKGEGRGRPALVLSLA